MTEQRPSQPVARPVLPGSTIGILGGGQLGRMMVIAAKRMGYNVVVLDPTANCPAGQVADDQIIAPYTDLDAARTLARRCQVATLEFENIPSATLAAMEPIVPVRPSSAVVRIAQDRLREKAFLVGHGFPVPRFEPVKTPADLVLAVRRIGRPAVLKVSSGGYDGKGQVMIHEGDSLEAVWRSARAESLELEEFVPLAKEISVIVARDPRGAVACFPPSENVHRHHILDTAVMPATVPEELAERAREMARGIAGALGVIGLLTVEMFLATDGRLLVNELAPRPHNSGHQTFDGAVTSQFEQAVRAVCGLPLGSTEMLRPTAIANLMGELWAKGEPAWTVVLAIPDVKLHLYGKAEARPGRKMGHLTAMGKTPEEALHRVLEARGLLGP